MSEAVPSQRERQSEVSPGLFTGFRNSTGKTIEGEVFHDAYGEMILYIKGAGTFHVRGLPAAVRAVEEERRRLWGDEA